MTYFINIMVPIKKYIAGFQIVSVQFLKDIGLQDIILKDIQQIALVPSPLLERILERILPSEEELFNSLSQSHFEGNIQVMQQPILYCDDNIDLVTKVCLKVQNGEHFVWTPAHQLWKIVFTMHILHKQKGTWITCFTQLALEIQSKEDFFLIPFHITFQIKNETPLKLLEENVKELCKTMDTLYNWTGKKKKKCVQTIVLVGVGAYTKLATDIISYYTSKRCTAVINLLILKQCQSKNLGTTQVAAFFEKVEQLKKCHACLLILNQPTTWFQTNASQNLAQCAEIIQRYTKTTGKCLILISTQELPHCLDHITHIVLNAQEKITKYCPVNNVLHQVNAWFEIKTQTLPMMLSNLEKAVVQTQVNSFQASTEYFDNVLTYFPSVVPYEINQFKKFLSSVFKSPSQNYSPRFLLKANHGKGKTALCHALKTLQGLTLIPIVMSDVIFSAFGVSQNYLRHLFNIARKNIPSILLVEDIENFTRHCSSDTCKWGEEIVTFMCTLIDGLPGTTVYQGDATVGILITTSDTHNNVKKMVATRFF